MDTITLDVAANGCVSIEAGSRIIAMSRFSGNAQVIAAEFAVGTHTLDCRVIGELIATDPAMVKDSCRVIHSIVNED